MFSHSREMCSFDSILENINQQRRKLRSEQNVGRKRVHSLFPDPRSLLFPWDTFWRINKPCIAHFMSITNSDGTAES